MTVVSMAILQAGFYGLGAVATLLALASRWFVYLVDANALLLVS